MNDPKLMGAPILRKTLCRLGGHVWMIAGRLDSGQMAQMPCDCKLYTWREWQKVLGEEQKP